MAAAMTPLMLLILILFYRSDLRLHTLILRK